MPPKAYADEDETDRQIIPRNGRDLIEPNQHTYQAVFAPLRSIGPGEILTILTLLYVCTIAAFNAAYFANVPGNFVEFFSLTDLIQTNLPIIQYFFSLFLTYGLIASALSFFAHLTGVDILEKLRDYLEPIMIRHHIEGRRFWLALIVALVLFWIINAVLKTTGVTDFTALMLPTFIFQGTLLYFFWLGTNMN